ncbi:MAG: hypothetical protein U1E86_17825 [Burkholderiaceae bacterium]
MSKLVALAVAALAVGTSFAQMPKEGPVDMSMCFGGPTQTLSPTPQDRFGTYALMGGVRAASGPAESLSVECLGIFETGARGTVTQGYCVFQDASGDRIFGVDGRNAQGYTWEWRGGTGRFAGITGSGVLEVVGVMAPVRPGTLQGCRRVTGRYRLP